MNPWILVVPKRKSFPIRMFTRFWVSRKVTVLSPEMFTVPLSIPGIVAGSMLVLIPSIGEYVIPELLGGTSTYMIGQVLWDEFFKNVDWSMASAVAVSMVVLILIPLAIFNHYQTRGVVRGSGT